MSVSIAGTKSTVLLCLSGVPQGSVFRPLLYILYTNDLLDVVSHAKIVMYANDIKLYLPVTDIAEQPPAV